MLLHSLITGFTPGAGYEYVAGNSLYLSTGIFGAAQPDGDLVLPGVFVATQAAYYIWRDVSSLTLLTFASGDFANGNGNYVKVSATFWTQTPGGLRGLIEEDGGVGGIWNMYDEFAVVRYQCTLANFPLGPWTAVEDSTTTPPIVTAGDGVTAQIFTRGTGWEEISDERVTRGYLCSSGTKRLRGGQITIGTWNPNYTVMKLEAGYNRSQVIASETRDRLRYLKPFNAAAWDPTNVNDDATAPNREDYSVVLPVDGIYLRSGVPLTVFQEVTEDFRIHGTARYVQFKIANTQGALQLKAVTFDANEGPRRKGKKI